MIKNKTTAILLLSSFMIFSSCARTSSKPFSFSTQKIESSQSTAVAIKCLLTIEMDSGIIITDLNDKPIEGSYDKGSTISIKASGPKGKEIDALLNGKPLVESNQIYSFVIEGDTILKFTLKDCTHKNLKTIDKVEPSEYKAGSISYYYCPNCEESFFDKDCKNKIESQSSSILEGDPRYIAPIQGEFSLLNSNVASYLNASTEAEQIKALKSVSPYNDQVSKTLQWEGTSSSQYYVDLSTDNTFSSYKRFDVKTNKLTLPGTLIPGTTYYWRVLDNNKNIINDDYSFRVLDTLPVRTLRVDGMFNMRDIGGWSAQGGVKIPYGKVYRGGNFSNITDEGKKTFIEELGIKTEIDLRTNGTNILNDDRVTYFSAGMWQYTMIIPGYSSPVAEDDGKMIRGFDSNSLVSLKAIFTKLANPSSYPIYFHCNAGADRTGTLAFLLNGLLGVSYNDLIKDFELTTFSSQGARYRSKVDGDHFDDSGIFENTTGNLISFGKMYDLIVTNYPTYNNTLVASIERYLKEVVGLDDETIKNVRLNMLGDNVTFDTVDWEGKDEPISGDTFTFENRRLTSDSVVSYENVTFSNKDCYKITMSGQGKIYFDLSSLKNYSKIKFDVYIAEENAKTLEGLGYFAFRVKPNDLTGNGYLDYHDSGTRKVKLGEWNSFEEDISSYISSFTEFSIVIPAGQVMYLANITGSNE